MKFIFVFLIFFLLAKCSKTVTVQYPIFPRTTYSNKIYNFIKDNKEIAVVIHVSEKNSKSFSQFLYPILNNLFKQKNSYYKIQMIENNKKKINSLKKSKIKIIAYFNFKEMIMECKENKNFRIIVFPIEMKLLNIKKKQTLNISLDSIQKVSKKNSCSHPLSITNKITAKSIIKIQKYFLPEFKNIKTKFFTKYKKDKVIEKILSLAYKEFKKGDIDNSIKFLQKIQKDKTWQGLANLGNCYYALGNLQKANLYYQQAISIKNIDKKNKQYLLKLNKEIIGTAIK